MLFPVAAVQDGAVAAVFEAPIPFVGPGDVQHPADAWFLWTEEDWAAMCPGWQILPVVDVVPADPTKLYSRLPFDQWDISDTAVTAAYDGIDKTPVQLDSEKTAAETALIEARKAAVQRHMDAQAMLRGYDSIATCVTYADEPAVPKFQAEGVAARAWRSLVWATCYSLLAEIQAGERAPMSDEELIAALPALEWPA